MPQDNEFFPSNVLVAYVGPRPLVVYVDNWVPGVVEIVTVDGEVLTVDGETVVVVV